MGEKSSTAVFPKKIIETIPKTTLHLVQDIGLGYTPSLSETNQLPAMTDKIPAKAIKPGHPAGQNLYPGHNTPDHSYQVEKASASAPVKNNKKKNKFIEIKSGSSENPGSTESPEPGAIIDWLINPTTTLNKLNTICCIYNFFNIQYTPVKRLSCIVELMGLKNKLFEDMWPQFLIFGHAE